MARRINTELLREWLEKNGDSSKALLALNARLSTSVIEKLATGTYPSTPRQITREMLSKAIGCSEDELFPLVKKKNAS